MTPIRVLHLINTLERGGAEQHLLSQFRAHNPAVVRPSVVTLYDRQPLAASFRAAGFAVGSLNLRSWRAALAGVAKFRAIVSALRPDIVQTALLEADIIGRIAARLGGQRRVVSAVHAPIYDPVVFADNPNFQPWKLDIIRRLDGWSGRWSQALYVGCASHVMQSVAAALNLAPEQQRVVYNGVTPLEPAGDGERHPCRLITVGRLDPQKGHRYLLEAMPAILAAVPQAELWIVGGGHLRQRLEEQIADLNLSAQVRLLGVRDDVQQLLSQSAVCVFPSLWEAMPIAPLEALSAGLPVVSTDIPAMREIIDPGVQGVLVPPQNPPALAQAIIGLLGDPARIRTLGAAGRQRIKERFDINMTVRGWEAVYQQMVAA